MKQTIIVPTHTIIHPRLDVIITRYVHDTPTDICNRIEAKKAIQRHSISMTYADYDYILDEIERREKINLNGMRVLIVTRNSTDGNNNNEILYVVVHYIIIKYLYENVIWFFILVMFISLYIILTDGVMFILLKTELVPKCI